MKNIYLVTIIDPQTAKGKEYACNIVLMSHAGIEMWLVDGTKVSIQASNVVLEVKVSA